MKFLKSEKTFSNIESSNILIFAIFVAYDNRWHISINWSSIEMLINANLEKASKLNSLEKVVLLGGTEFHGLHDDLKITWRC